MKRETCRGEFERAILYEVNCIEQEDATSLQEVFVATIPENYRDLLEKPIAVGLATVLPNGQPQVTPVWCDFDGTYIRVNTSTSRQKYKDMLERPQVTVLAIDPANQYRYMEVRGTVARTSEEGADAHIDKLAHDYMGVDSYPMRNPAETRVICYIEPEKVIAQG